MRGIKPYICAGLYGSGSTLLFNAIRYVLLNQNKAVYSDFYLDREIPAASTKLDAVVYKAHEFVPALALSCKQCFITVRHPVDIVRSMIRRNHLANDETIIREFLLRLVESDYKKWSMYADNVFKYEDIAKNKKAFIKTLIMDMDADLSLLPVIIDDLEKLDLMVLVRRDHASQLWPRHHSNESAFNIDFDLEKTALDSLEEYMDEFGYRL